MGIYKYIHLISQEAQILNTTSFRLRYYKTYDVSYRQHVGSLSNLLESIRSLCKREAGYYDLLVFFGYSIDSYQEYEEYLARIETGLKDAPTRVLFVCTKAPFKLNTMGKRCEVTSFEVYSDEVSFRNIIDRMLSVPYEDYETRRRICDPEQSLFYSAQEEIAPWKAAILAKLGASHIFAPVSEFSALNVSYVGPNICNYEEIADHKLDPEYKHLDSTEEFHLVITAKQRRITHLLIGHRGCGKSSFIHSYFRVYEPFVKLRQPYIIVDFLNYGFLADSYNVQFSILSCLYKHLSAHGIAELIQKFPVIKSLYAPEATSVAIDCYRKMSVPFSEVISDEIAFEIDRAIGDVGHVHVGLKIAEDENIANGNIKTLYEEWRSNHPWEWLAYVWDYITEDSEEKPFRFFANWIFDRAFDEEPCVEYASNTLFLEHMSSWRDKYLNKDKLSTCNLRELEHIVNSFFDGAVKCFGRMFVALDNIDMLASTLAEYRMMQSIYKHIAPVYEKLKIIVSIRPATYYAQKASLEKEIIPEDTTAYYKYWLHKVKLQSVITKRISLLHDVHQNEKEIEFLNAIVNLTRYNVKAYEQDKEKKTILSIIDGLTGNNVRDGLELFCDTVKVWHKYLGTYGGMSLFRKSKKGHVYVAEHIAIRALFLRRDKEYEFKSGLVNLFYVPGLCAHESTLIQIRILEVLRSLTQVTLPLLFSYLNGLGYNNNTVILGLRQLQTSRLVAIIPYAGALDPASDDVSVVMRHRGLFYYEKLICRLSYIQMVYFMSLLPERLAYRLSYPNPPTVRNGQLDQLVENVLTLLWLDISHERQNAQPAAVGRYVREVCSLEEVHKSVLKVYWDLKDIWRSIGVR